MRRNQIPLLLFGFLAIASLMVGKIGFAEDEKRRCNVLFIAVDDLRPELGCYGAEHVHSPNIDALAASGVTFESAHCQVAVCNPSRVSVMTGMRPDSTRVWDLVTRFRDTVPDAVTLPSHFVEHGYRAISFGKIFHNPWPDNRSWSEPHQWPKESSLWSREAKQRQQRYRDRMREAGKPERLIARIRPPATEIVDIEDHQHIDGAIARQAIEEMEDLAETEQPFFLAVGFVRPHLPFVVPRKYWDLYDREEIELSGNPYFPKDAPEFAMNTMYELRDYSDFHTTLPPDRGSLSESQQRRLKHGYLASVSLIDSLVGELLACLDRLQLADDTTVVLWSDHGWKLGEHNSWCKQTNYEIDTRVPLIVRVPGTRGSETKGDYAKGNRANEIGTRVSSPVELIDLFPTLCDVAGLPIPAQLEGISLHEQIADPMAKRSRPAFSQFRRQNGTQPLMGYAMRTDRYRYIEWQDRRSGAVVTRELYDHSVDVNEDVNLADRESNEVLVNRLSRQMWGTLPQPPSYEAPEQPRPEITFRNNRDKPITLYWMKPDSGEKKIGLVKPGGEITQKTTLGHRFIARGDSFSSKVLKADRRRKTIIFSNKRKRPGSDGEGVAKEETPATGRRPNIVVCVADDWSWPHAGILGDPVVKTPSFDRVANEGVLFENAFVSCPSCTPSRLSILTGQHHWRLREGDSLGGSLREEFDVYTELLQVSGYKIGRFGKGVWPSEHRFRQRDSFGERYRNFDAFLDERNDREPFCYWHGGQDPHRPYELGIGEKSGIDLSGIRVPACLPDDKIVRGDLADYFWEVQRFDREVGTILKSLERIGELERTIVVVTSDNGMPFPRCKATLHDFGTRVPLAIRWGNEVKGGRSVSDFVSLCDLAPTFLEVAGIAIPDPMTGRSLVPQLSSELSGQIEAKWSFVVSGVEKHVYLYPKRSLRTKDYLYIRNFEPEAWPTGEVDGKNPEYDFSKQPWPTTPGAFSFAIDPSPTKQFLRFHRKNPLYKSVVDLSLSRPPQEQLYDLKTDPEQVVNVASQARLRGTLRRLRGRLEAEMIRSSDPRADVPGYRSHEVEGWPIRVSDSLRKDHPEKTERALVLLAEQLRTVKQLLPPSATKVLRDVPIWFSTKYEGFGPTGEYHPGEAWLRKNGRHPKLHRCIEFTNVPLFEQEIRRMPVLVLHELAHAFHDQVLGFGNEGVKATFEIAKNNGSYDAVKRGNGRIEKAYAMSNEREYFAETSEAFFGRNDFFPFDRAELKKHDPRMESLLEELWKTTR